MPRRICNAEPRLPFYFFFGNCMTPSAMHSHLPLRSIQVSNTLSSSTNDNMDVHVYGPNVATVSGTTTEKGKGKGKDGKQFTRSYVWVDTWMERNGKWECIAEGVMQLPKKK